MLFAPKLLPIYLFSNPILNQPTKKIEEITDDIRNLIVSMKYTLTRVHGAGLAANQVGANVALCIALGKIFINPVIVGNNGKIKINMEGCLSIPKIPVMVERYEKIEIEYYDETMKKFHIGINDEYFARVIQHEYEHLLGKTILSYLTPTEEQQQTLTKLSKGHLHTPYLSIP